jgi:hypothetical protein
VPFYEGDIADAVRCWRGSLPNSSIGAIMHFAGSMVVPESVADPLKYYHNNTAKSRALIAAAVRAGVPHFIFSSTAATYGIPDVAPVTEDTPQQPINPYGWSKLMTEQMLADVAAAHPLNYGVLRYFNVAGADPQARSGQSTAGATHLIKVAVEAALGLRDIVSVFGTDYRHARWHRRARLYPCQRSCRRARAGAGGADRRAGALADDELRLWPGLLGARGARRGRPGDESQARAAARPAPAGDPDSLISDPSRSRRRCLAAAARRSRHDRRPCAGVGAQIGRFAHRGHAA